MNKLTPISAPQHILVQDLTDFELHVARYFDLTFTRTLINAKLTNVWLHTGPKPTSKKAPESADRHLGIKEIRLRGTILQLHTLKQIFQGRPRS